MTDRLISCDDHMDLSQLPADLWTTRLPASLLDRAPHVEELDGQAVWVCDGKVWGRWDGKPPATGSARPIKALYNALRPRRHPRPEGAPPGCRRAAPGRHGPRRRRGMEAQSAPLPLVGVALNEIRDCFLKHQAVAYDVHGVHDLGTDVLLRYRDVDGADPEELHFI
jgi:hypothetical protein